MIKNNNDIGFIHDIGSLDRLRQQAVNGEEGSEKEMNTTIAFQTKVNICKYRSFFKQV
jgi:flagellar protein FlgJ